MLRLRQQPGTTSCAPGLYLSVLVLLLGMQLSGCSLLRSIGLLPASEAAEEEVEQIPLSAQPYEFTLILNASDDVNQDSQSRPSPIRTRVFLSGADARLAERSFGEIFQFKGMDIDPAPAITLMLQPGESRRIKLNGMKSQDVLTVAAAYRDHYSVNWIASKQIYPDKAVRFTAQINASSIAITTQ